MTTIYFSSKTMSFIILKRAESAGEIQNVFLKKQRILAIS